MYISEGRSSRAQVSASAKVLRSEHAGYWRNLKRQRDGNRMKGGKTGLLGPCRAYNAWGL